MPIYDNCFHITVTGLTAGTHTAYSIFRSLNYEYEDSTSKEYYFKVNKIPLTLKFNGLTQYNNYDIRETSNIELEIEFNVVGVNVWGNEVQAYNFPYKVYCNDVLLTGDDHVFTYTFEKAGTYTFKVVSEENEKYLASEYSETIVITDSGATETNITIDFTTDSQSSTIYSYDTIHITANITPSDLSNKVILKIYRNNNLIDTITGNTFTNSDKLKVGNYKVIAEYEGDKFYLPCSDEYTFTVTAEPTDFTNLKFTTTTGNTNNVYINDIINITGTLKSTKNNIPLKNTKYSLIILCDGRTISDNIYTTDDNGNINNSYKFMESGSITIKLEYDGDDEYYAPISKSKSLTCSKKPVSLSGYKTGLWQTNQQIVYLKDVNGVAISKQYVIFYVNGIYYERLTDNQGMAKLTINLNPGNFNMVIGFNDETMINNCNNQKKTNILVNNNYGSAVKEFTMTVKPAVTVTKHAVQIADISINNESRAWGVVNPSLISTESPGDYYPEYMACMNINNRYSKIKRPNSLHFTHWGFNIPDKATISSIKVRFKTTFWGHNNKPASFDPAWCGFPALSNQGYEQGETPLEAYWTESVCVFNCYGEDKKYNITPSFLNNDFVFSIDFGLNTSDNSANFGLAYFELSVYYCMPDEEYFIEVFDYYE